MISSSGLITDEEAKRALGEVVPELDRHISERNIEILNEYDWYLEEKGFNINRVVTAWDVKLKRALALGYNGMRVSGDTFWLSENYLKNFYAYEKQVTDFITDLPMTIMCTYPLAKSEASAILDVVHAHQFAIARRQGEWEVIQSPEFIRAKAEIKRLNEVRQAERENFAWSTIRSRLWCGVHCQTAQLTLSISVTGNLQAFLLAMFATGGGYLWFIRRTRKRLQTIGVRPWRQVNSWRLRPV